MSAQRKSGKSFFPCISATKRVRSFSNVIFPRNDPYYILLGRFKGTASTVFIIQHEFITALY